MMRKIYAISAMSLLIMLSNPAVADEVLTTNQQTFTVKYKDGTKERHIVRYQAVISQSQNETGGPSTWTHPIDDRQCHWQIHTYIQRDIGIIDHSGQVAWREDWRRIFDNPVQERAPGLGIKTGFQGVNCGKVADQINQEVAAAKSNVITGLPAIMAKDRDAVSTEVKGDGQVIKVG